MAGLFRRATRPSPFGSRLLGPEGQPVQRLRVRVQILLTVLLLTTNLVSASIVIVISIFLVPAPPATGTTLVALAISVPTYVVMAVILGATVGTSTTLRALDWAREGREPQAADRLTALRVPLRLTQMQGLLWFGATLTFTTLALIFQPARALSTALTVGIAGIVGCGIAFLLSEFALRPVSARVLAGQPFLERPRGAGVGARMVIFWLVGTAAPVAGLIVAGILALTDDETSPARLAVITIVIGVVVLSFGLFVTVLNSRSVVAPIVSVSQALRDVECGDLDREVVVYDGTELGLLQSGFNEMVSGLREREHLRDLFGRHVGEDVARAAADTTGGRIELGGEIRTVSVLFVDLVGSTGFATVRDANVVVDMLNRFFGVVVDEVDRNHGLVNKFMGDAVLAIFGAPSPIGDHAGAALSAARAMAARLAEEIPEIGAGIGVATGEVVAGNVGHQHRFEYTVIGDAVNSASRLTELAKEVHGHVLVSWDTVRSAESEEAQHWIAQGSTTLRGRPTKTPLGIPRSRPWAR